MRNIWKYDLCECLRNMVLILKLRLLDSLKMIWNVWILKSVRKALRDSFYGVFKRASRFNLFRTICIVLVHFPIG